MTSFLVSLRRFEGPATSSLMSDFEVGFTILDGFDSCMGATTFLEVPPSDSGLNSVSETKLIAFPLHCTRSCAVVDAAEATTIPDPPFQAKNDTNAESVAPTNRPRIKGAVLDGEAGAVVLLDIPFQS